MDSFKKPVIFFEQFDRLHGRETLYWRYFKCKTEKDCIKFAMDCLNDYYNSDNPVHRKYGRIVFDLLFDRLTKNVKINLNY